MISILLRKISTSERLQGFEDLQVEVANQARSFLGYFPCGNISSIFFLKRYEE
jgi:hypothetical protein